VTRDRMITSRTGSRAKSAKGCRAQQSVAPQGISGRLGKMLWSSNMHLVMVHLQPSRDALVADLLRVLETSPKVRGG
jgi:hypothetical protein